MNEYEDNIDSLLDNSLSDLADLPEFKPFPEGAHRCIFNIATKKIGDNPALVIQLKAVETVELADPSRDEPLIPGSEAEVSFQLNNEFGQGAAKKLAAKFLAAQGLDPKTSTLRQAFEPFANAELIFVTTKRADKKDKEKFYMNIVEVIFDTSASATAKPL